MTSADTATTRQPPGETFNFAQYLLARNADRTDKVACIDDHGAMTYGQLADRTTRFAAALGSLGVRREERVLLLMHDSNAWPAVFLGALYAGVVPVAVNTLLTADDYAYMLEHSRAQVAIVSAELRDVLAAAVRTARHEVHTVVVAGAGPIGNGDLALDTLLADSQPLAAPAPTGRDDIGFWLYSSGSTGRPKGTVHTQAAPWWTAELYGRGVLGITEDDVCFSAAKLYFAYGLGNALTFPLSVGATAVLMAGRPTPEVMFERLQSQRATVFFCAPTGYAGMLASPQLPARDALALRLCSSAGEALPEELGRRFSEHFGVDVCDGIGSTEMLHVFLSNAPGRVRYGTTGWPVPGYEVALRDEAGQPVPDGEIGDLYVSGPSAALMYWGNRSKSLDTFQGTWTRTGDRYVRNDDGSYTCVGRSDDMFKVSGMYVSPFEVEASLVTHPAVLESAVIGVADADGLIKSRAYVVRLSGADVDAAELQAHVKARLAPYKYPRSIEFVDELPKTATGKIMRFRLRERAAGQGS